MDEEKKFSSAVILCEMHVKSLKSPGIAYRVVPMQIRRRSTNARIASLTGSPSVGTNAHFRVAHSESFSQGYPTGNSAIEVCHATHTSRHLYFIFGIVRLPIYHDVRDTCMADRLDLCANACILGLVGTTC